MITLAQRKRKRKEHKELVLADKENTRIINLLSDEKYQKHLLLGILAATGTLPDFQESKVCTCCGKSQRRFSSNTHKVCTDCLGQSIEGTLVPEWSNTPIAFTLSYEGTTQTFSSISQASKILGLPQCSLHNLVSGQWAQYKGMVCTIIPNARTYDDLEALRASKRLK